ncbi:TIGR03087 family PEP-CTERM/XrtA system glycosyltransferase [Fimbriiglobus ruber]|uniref:Glycosyltransferase n=1 Tax=Fimbriiglobus ruber TaxID=1908690 RepID=A0A225E6X9_9BACT|nr:TIGR03087 family PEP-CTERM/XrtA system glycosyltransferase [Fimbriiglobus ruber]OWK47514.1 Glycosyltransferase [Fimbriiglobus ruber]
MSLGDVAHVPTTDRVLYITHRVPFPPDKGDRIRNYHVLRQLAARVPVRLLALADEPVPAETRGVLGEMCERVAIVPVGRFAKLARAGLSVLGGGSLTEGAFRVPAADRILREWVGEVAFRAAVVSTSGLAPYLRRSGLDRVPGFVDLVDVDSQKWFDYAAATNGPKRRLYRFEGRRVRALERGLPRWTSGVGLVSAAEAAVYESFAGSGTALVATNGVDLDYFRPTPDVPEVPACAFVGAMDYLPNVDAAAWFVANVWPLIRAHHPAAEFWIIGRKPVPAVQRLSAVPGVVVVGQVPDVRPHVAKAAVCVTPMRLSRGLQNKVLEALAMSKAVVAAPPALAALRTEVGTHLLSATTPDEWASVVGRLFDSPDRRRELGAAGRQFVEEHHHWDRCLRPLLDRVCGGRESSKVDAKILESAACG